MADGNLISRASLLAGIAELKESPWYNFGKVDGTSPEGVEAIWHYGYLQRKDAVEIIEDICIKKEPAVLADSGWISVKDRLPEDDGKYMVWYKGEADICEFDTDSQTFGYTYDDYDEMYSHLVCWDDGMNKDVTHWQHLPERPKGE